MLLRLEVYILPLDFFFATIPTVDILIARFLEKQASCRLVHCSVLRVVDALVPIVVLLRLMAQLLHGCLRRYLSFGFWHLIGTYLNIDQ